MRYIEELQDVIRRLHGCDADYLETVAVTETFQSQTVWQGEVEVFAIRGHPKATRADAWAHASGENDKDKRYVAVLGLPHINSPKDAVRAAIVEEAKSARETKESRSPKVS